MQHKGLIVGGSIVVLVGGYVLLKRRASASGTPTGPVVGGGDLPSNNATVATQTANPTLQLLNGNYSNNQGNYGMSSDSSYAMALQNEAGLSAAIAGLSWDPNTGTLTGKSQNPNGSQPVVNPGGALILANNFGA